ncbi:MAG: hypothetical protein HY098_00735 [Nitrospinae bacterium]|nr:hypothetical protein [Nitrospinota bacterium]
MKKLVTAFFVVIGALILISAGVYFIPNPLGRYVVSEAKANGYLPYTPSEAYGLAMNTCTQCHTDERIKKYCERCGPPFIAVVPHMQSFIENYKLTKPNLKVHNITESQAVAIVQVWNAILGNWEKDFREQDIYKLIGDYPHLKALYKMPIKDRPIESALMNREDLKVGYMADMSKSQKMAPKNETGPKRENEHEHKP